jgi:Cu(I)/Ag(I) efflux system membrane fusion protein
MATRTVPVRIVLPNADGRLRPGLFAEVAFGTDSGETMVAIPDSAVIDSGRRRVAFVAKGEGLFEPRELETGARGDGYVEIRKGVDDGENVVVRGTFLVDAESNLKAALAGFAPAENGK